MKTLIIGSGVSGRAVFKYLKNKNYDCCFLEELGKNVDELTINDLKNFGQIIVSPGVKLDKKLIFQIKQNKIAFYGELEFGTSKIKNNLIAVTGTNGKTTTVSLLGFLFRKYISGCEVCGNIGIPVTSLIEKLSGDEIIVLECSSFQLETIEKFSPHIALVLNISEDHLNRHKTMNEYIRCKYNITKNQTKNDYLILNADDEILSANPPKTKANILYFSTHKKVRGVYIKNKIAYYFDGLNKKRLLSLSNVKLKGEHNLSNILAAILCVYLQTKDVEILKDVLKFEGVAHRIEFVKNIRGIDFYNDSKATNISSTIVACNSFSCGVNLILGGSDKGYDFDELFKKLPKNIKTIAVFGETKHKIAFSIKKFNINNFYICDTLKQCVEVLFEKSLAGDVILLSPACASFDQFDNFEHRGNVFKNIVFDLDK